MLTQRTWWIGVGAVVAALVFHAAFPRYEFRHAGELLVRVDRWTGTATLANGRTWTYASPTTP